MTRFVYAVIADIGTAHKAHHLIGKIADARGGIRCEIFGQGDNVVTVSGGNLYIVIFKVSLAYILYGAEMNIVRNDGVNAHRVLVIARIDNDNAKLVRIDFPVRIFVKHGKIDIRVCKLNRLVYHFHTVHFICSGADLSVCARMLALYRDGEDSVIDYARILFFIYFCRNIFEGAA